MTTASPTPQTQQQPDQADQLARINRTLDQIHTLLVTSWIVAAVVVGLAILRAFLANL